MIRYDLPWLAMPCHVVPYYGLRCPGMFCRVVSLVSFDMFWLVVIYHICFDVYGLSVLFASGPYGRP